MAHLPPSIDMAQLVSDHHAVIYRYAYRLSGSTADAEDLTQHVFLVAQQKIGQVRDPSRVRGWLYAVLRSCYLRSRRRKIPMPAGDLKLDVESIPQEVPDDVVDEQLLQAAIDRLPADFKMVVMMFYFEQCSYLEIAEALSIPMGTVMSRLSRAKGHLRRQLLPLGVSTANPDRRGER